MRATGIHSFRSVRRMLAVFGLGLIPAAAAGAGDPAPAVPGTDEAPPAGERIEEIEIVGQRSLIQLRSELRAIEGKAFKLFNELNSDDEFDVHCSRETPTGSRISYWQCVPRYLVNAQAQNAQDFLLFGMAMKDQEQIWWENRYKHAQLNAEMKALAAQNPELLTTLLDLQAKQQRLEALEREKRSASPLRRLFGRSDTEDEE